MAGIRTAPTVDGTISYKTVSIAMYDYTGERRSVAYKIDAGASNAQIEALVATTQALTNGTIFRVTVGEVYNSVGDSSNANEEVWEDVKTNVVILAKNALDDSKDAFIPAPINGMFIEGTEQIDPTNVALGAFLTAWLATITGFSVVSGRFSQRSDIGTKINF